MRDKIFINGTMPNDHTIDISQPGLIGLSEDQILRMSSTAPALAAKLPSSSVRIPSVPNGGDSGQSDI